MRVVIASHSAGLRGGAERCVLDLVTGLRADGRVEPIVTAPMKGELTSALTGVGVKFEVVPTTTWLVDESPPWPDDPFRLLRRLKRAGRVVGAVPKWVSLLRSLQPSVVISSTTVSPMAALASRRIGVPHIWWIHEFTTLGLDKRYVLGEPVSQRIIGRFSDSVAVNSDAVQEHYSPPISATKITRIELGVEPPAVEANAPHAGKLRVLVLGRKAPAKGCETALRAVAAIANGDTDISLRMVGPALPGYAETLWYLARDLAILERVEFIEYAPDPFDHFAWANVVVVPSRGEAFGRVTVEALKSGRPVIGARSGATVELIEDEQTGLLFDPGDVAALGAALRRCAAEPTLVDKMSANAIASMGGRFTLDGEVETFVRLIERVTTRDKEEWKR